MWDKFSETVDRYFGFLETEFKFVQKSDKPPLVIFESEKLRIMVFYDAGRGHELDLIIRRIADDPQKPLSLSVDMLLEFRGHSDAAGHRLTHPSTPEALETEVKSLADRLRTYGSALLNGDLRDFDRLERAEKDLAREFGKPKQPK